MGCAASVHPNGLERTIAESQTTDENEVTAFAEKSNKFVDNLVTVQKKCNLVTVQGIKAVDGDHVAQGSPVNAAREANTRIAENLGSYSAKDLEITEVTDFEAPVEATRVCDAEIRAPAPPTYGWSTPNNSVSYQSPFDLAPSARIHCI